ncbi:MAG: lysylphosphatidylglycerol synthase transmembrane domain-containing protein [bacterium]
MRIGERDYNIKAGLTFFIGISIISILVIMFLDIDRNTWMNLRKIRLEYGLIASILMVTQWSFNGIRFKILLNSLDNKVSFWTSLKAFMANVFMSAMTPSQTGGGALQIYVLNRAGVSIAKAFTGCLMGAVLTVFCLLVLTLGTLLFKPDLRVELGHQMMYIFMLVCAVFLFMFALFTLSLLKIKIIKRITGRLLLFLTGLVKSKKRLGITKRVLSGLDQYSKCMSIYAHTKKYKLFLACLYTFAAIITNSFIAPVLFVGLNVHCNSLNVFLTQFILLFIAYFGPTPGASGIAEFSNYWMMSSLNIDSKILGIYTLIWRFYTSFIGVIVGGIITLTLLKQRNREN